MGADPAGVLRGRGLARDAVMIDSDAKSGSRTPGDLTEQVAATRLPLYAQFYGLREAPFDLTPNPRFVFLAGRQREVLSNLRYALSTAKTCAGL